MPNLFERVVANDNLYQAWLKVGEASGCAGIDGVGVEDFEHNLDRHLHTLRADLADRSYRPLPLRRFFVPKRCGGLRPLGVPAVRDRVAQAAAVLQLQPLVEPLFLPCSYAYRPGRSWLQAVNELCRLRDRGDGFVLRADIDRFFDTLSHDRLLAMLRKLTRDPYLVSLVQQWLTTPVCENGNLLPVTRGVPQGGVISPLLSNLYLTPFDHAVTDAGLRLIRYADDFVIACAHEAQAKAALEVVSAALAALDLALEPTKTGLTSFAEGFEFVGTVFRGRERILPLRGGYSGKYACSEAPQPLPRGRRATLWQEGLLPLHLVEQHAFCPRAAGLRMLTGEEMETPEMIAGRAAEAARHRRHARHPDASLRLECPVTAPVLGVQGLVDAVEEKWDTRVPIEYRWSWSEEVHEPVAIRLTAAAMALQENTAQPVLLAYVEFLPSGKRVAVELTPERRHAVGEQIAGLREILQRWELPPPSLSERCGGCSCRPACLPEETQEFRELLEKMIGG